MPHPTTDMPDIAVVIPLFNHERFIGKAIESCLAQSIPPGRVIVVDDGSSDHSVKAAKAVADTRVEIYEQPNLGAHAALNRGLDLAKGCDVVAILNSDDWFLPGRFAACWEVLQSEPEAGLICTGIRLVNDTDAVLDPAKGRGKWFQEAWSVRQTGLPLVAQLATANFPATTSNFFGRHGWFHAHPFRKYRFAHDYFHLLEAALENKLRIVDEPLLAYRVHDSNTINTEPCRLTLELQRIHFDLMCHFAPRLPDDPGLRARFATYFHRAWHNRSSFKADLFVALTAMGMARLDAGTMECLFENATHWPEWNVYPNVGVKPDYLDPVPRPHLVQVNAEWSAAKCLIAIQGILLASRWISLGRFAGFFGGFCMTSKENAVETLAATRKMLRTSWWVRFGVRLGSGRLRQLERDFE